MLLEAISIIAVLASAALVEKFFPKSRNRTDAAEKGDAVLLL